MRRLPQDGGCAGFTLMELMVVLVIIGIMAAMIVPQMQGSFEDAVLRSSGRKIINVLNLAYSQSISQNQSYRVHLDSVMKKFQVERKLRGSDRNGEFIPLKDLPGGQGAIDSRISLEVHRLAEEPGEGTEAGDVPADVSVEPSQDITFFPDGTAEGSEIVLKDRAGFKLLLQVSATTGRVRIVEPEPK